MSKVDETRFDESYNVEPNEYEELLSLEKLDILNIESEFDEAEDYDEDTALQSFIEANDEIVLYDEKDESKYAQLLSTSTSESEDTSRLNSLKLYKKQKAKGELTSIMPFQLSSRRVLNFFILLFGVLLW